MSLSEASYTIAIDTGGTFTDLVVSDEERVLGLFKALTTPKNLFDGIEEAMATAANAIGTDLAGLAKRTKVFVYSTTHSTNAILEGKVAKTGFITTRGHRDILLYKEGGKDDVHNMTTAFPKPYVRRRMSFELTERILSDGAIAVPLDEAEVRQVLTRLGELETEAIGVCLLWSPLNPAHEERVGELIEEVLPGVAYSLSHRVNRIIREYRRASATVIDASIKPLMQKHLGDMDSRLRALGFAGEPLMVTHVSGGVLRLDQIAERPLQSVDSGPALAPIAGQVFERAEPSVNGRDVLVADTGGTSFDVSLVIGDRVAYTREKWLGKRWYGDMTGLPAVDTRSIGAGGGSIASVDPGGLLHVGPDSAGSDPGPAAYGRGGTAPTVTDAAVVLGYIDANNFLGGRMVLDPAAARRAIEDHLCGPLGLSAEASAEAVLVVATEQMRNLIMDATVAQGRDARECLMVAGGGAAGLNIVRIGREIGLRQIVIPKLAAGLSAVGGLFSDITAVFSRGHYTVSTDFDFAGVNRALAELTTEMDNFFEAVGHEGTALRRVECEARYDQQMWEIDVNLGELEAFRDAQDVVDLQQRFDANHLSLFAVNQPGFPIETITWRAEARIERHKPSLSDEALGAEEGKDAAPSSGRRTVFDGASVETPIFRGDDLRSGDRIVGPAIIEEPTTTIVVIPGAAALVRPTHYLIDVGESTKV